MLIFSVFLISTAKNRIITLACMISVTRDDYSDLVDKNDIEQLRILVEDFTQEELWEVLNYASVVDEIDSARLMLDMGVDPNILRGLDRTPLHQTALYGSYGVFKLLLDRGADINIQDDWGDTPFHNAATNMHPTLLSDMIRGAELNIKNEKNETPLDNAIKYGPSYNVAELVAAGANSGKGFFAATCKYAWRLTKEFWNYIRVIILFRIVKKYDYYNDSRFEDLDEY